MTAFLWTMLWQTLLVALAAAAFAALLRGQPAASRHRLFLGALLVAALLPAANAWVHLTLTRASSSGANVVVETTAPAPTATAPADSPVGAPSQRPDLGLVLGGLWAGTMLLQAARLTRRAWRAQQAWRQASPERVVAGVPVLRGAGGPFTLGWLRPRIVLPAALLEREAWSAAALAHELAHVRRRDYLWAWLGELALVPLAWHPAAHWLARKAALEREAACDQAALAADPAYPSHLVDIAAALHGAAMAHGGLGLAHRRGLEQRIAWLTAPAPRRSRARLAVAVAGLSLAVTAVWGLGGGVRSAPGPGRHQVQAAAPAQTGLPVQIGEGLQAAMCLECRPPLYPPAARAAGLQGTVEMHVLIANDGTVAAINCGVGDPALLAAAEDAVRGWRYRPLLLDGQPVSVSSLATTIFQLSDGAAPPFIRGLSGVACDDQGARVAGALVVATATGSSDTSQATTAADGTFDLDLADGRYEVEIQKPGFRQHRQPVTLPLEHPWLVVLTIGQADQTVLVTGGPRRR